MGELVMQMAERMSQSQTLTPDKLQKIIRIFEAVMQKPELYAELRKTLQQVGIDTSWLPEQFSEDSMLVLLGALYVLVDGREQAPQQPQELQPQQPPAFARGGLNDLAAQGRGGDSQLAHINPFEAGVLRSMGGSGAINPRTGLREYDMWSDLGDSISDIGSSLGGSLVGGIADYFAPGLGDSILGSAAIGGVGSALSGGNFLQGATAGALSGGLGGTVGNWAGDAMGMELGKGAADALGSGLVGGALGAVTGQGMGQGAARGALGSVVGNAISGMGDGNTAMGQGIQQGGRTAGGMLSAGYSGQEAAIGGGLAGLARGMTAKPSQIATSEYSAATDKNIPEYGYSDPAADGGNVKPYGSAQASDGLTFKKAMAAAPAIMSLFSAAQTPEEVQKTIPSMSPQQQEYFNRESQHWDWDKLKADAAGAGQGLGQYMAQNWDKLTADSAYVKPPVKLAMGGLGMLAQGGGSGRADTIDAKLSDGEYVMDAETVSMLGDGSTKEGAKRLDQMRQQLRQHKGKIMAKGKFSPDAKSPLSYLKKAA